MTIRTASPRVERLFVDRWSPRSFDGRAIPQEDLETIFEAAGLAPSAFNAQPWRFLYARRGDANWERFLSLLIPFNASWAKEAGALIYILSEKVVRQGDEDVPLRSHSFDAGAAWAQMALQATALGYHAHAMAGVDFERARMELAVPEGFAIDAAVAIGTRAPAQRLPKGLREREVPSPRKPVGEIALAGSFR